MTDTVLAGLTSWLVVCIAAGLAIRGVWNGPTDEERRARRKPFRISNYRGDS